MAFDLHQFGNWYWYFELFASHDNVYILEFEYMSNQNVNEMCGAGQEKGYLYLEYNSKTQLSEYEIFYIESCFNGIWIEAEKTSGGKIKYLIEDTGNDFKYNITVDKQNASLEYLVIE